MSRLFYTIFFLITLQYSTNLWSIEFGTELNEDQKKVAGEIFSNTMSPFCPGRLLSDCPSTSTSELKEEIRARIVSGESKSNIEDYLYNLYGEKVRAAPLYTGFGLTAWLMPAAFLFIGGLLIAIWLKRNFKLQTTSKNKSLDSDWSKKVDEELS